ncbi:hypothetical protein A1Q2_02467 [Trichosporon asahii var. asahii CBS 8904]|uniref:Uncharacterized protein n=1 Tax=Trichosporon asahii var. asahii (strain CBS 8904) TaxID=1220162 RepID=K1VRN8_TRIAC|nr:hypothetical protein A1Q2_02467 [Trichosporon asahii var. asahii CBS 8904]
MLHAGCGACGATRPRDRAKGRRSPAGQASAQSPVHRVAAWPYGMCTQGAGRKSDPETVDPEAWTLTRRPPEDPKDPENLEQSTGEPLHALHKQSRNRNLWEAVTLAPEK